MEAWPTRLEQTFNQMLVDSRPIAIYWGPSFTTIYNEAFSKLCGSKHPALLGTAVEAVWGQDADKLKETMSSIARKQTGVREGEFEFFVDRAPEGPDEPSWLEEVYLKWSLIPIVEENECLGFMHPVVDTTSMRLWERRMKMLIDLGEVLVTARDVKSYWEKTIQQLETVEPRYDIPLAILYSVEEDPDAMTLTPSITGATKICRLAGALSVAEGHPIAPETISLRLGATDALSVAFRDAMSSHHPLLLQTRDGTLPKDLLEGLSWRGFGDPCRAAVVLPIRPTKEENTMGLLLLGLNPRRPYDNDYRQYISLLSQKLTTSLASIVLLEEEARRGRNAAEQAAYDQALLKEKLAVQTKEANESIQMFEAVAEFVPVGMCFGDADGNITFANDAWYKITGYPGYPGNGTITNQGFLACVREEDRQVIVAEYEKLKTTRNVEFEFRVKTQAGAGIVRNSPSFERAGLDLTSAEDMSERHVLAAAKAERASDGSILRVLMCLTDVTAHKQAAEEAVRRAQQAENLKRMAEFATVGMYDMDLEGRLLGANRVFFEMCGLSNTELDDQEAVKPWEKCVVEEDYPILVRKIERMVMEDKVQNVEVRLRTTWMAEDSGSHKAAIPRWVQATLMPVRSSEGVIQSFTGCLSDVSLQKWQLDREKQRKEEAIESKRQQENFIDMTSHEMRNPLSAIIHCADAITASLAKVQELMAEDADVAVMGNGALAHGVALTKLQAEEPQGEARDLVVSCIDNAETIVGCAQHQKRIVDDILTMSKLDSKLLAITPITVNPILMVQEALKMFEVEARRVDINLSMDVDQSYRELGIRYLDFDPSRLKQVLINLLTNALKFTKTGPTRNVSVTVSASMERPTEATSSVQFIPRESEEEDCPMPVTHGRGSRYLMFEVKDTGQGLTEEEKKSLFQRFVQASSRTHVKYGGSGLGLFISRRLTELQNGAIGVASQPGVGSTFAFYIEAHIPTERAIQDAEAAAAAAKAALSGLRLAPSPSLRTKRSASATSGSTTPSSGPRPSPITTTPTLDANATPPPPIKGVLVVEDNLINQQITRRGLASMGFTVDVANHGVECLDKLRRTDRFVKDAKDGSCNGGKPNRANGTIGVGGRNGANGEQTAFPLSIILMDIEMPVQDGLTCTRNIRQLEREGKLSGGRLPIIAVSANARLEQIQEAKEAGCDDVLVKPYRMPELLEKMKVVMGMVAAEGLVM